MTASLTLGMSYTASLIRYELYCIFNKCMSYTASLIRYELYCSNYRMRLTLGEEVNYTPAIIEWWLTLGEVNYTPAIIEWWLTLGEVNYTPAIIEWWLTLGESELYSSNYRMMANFGGK